MQFAHAAAASVTLILAAPALAQDPPAGQIWSRFSVSEVKPGIDYSGPVNALARDPGNRYVLFAGSGHGGLFRSNDGGATWFHVDGLPVREITALGHYPENPGVVVATARADHAVIPAPYSDGTGAAAPSSGGGVWVSRDGGQTWSHPAAAVPATDRRIAGCPADHSAHDVSFGGGAIWAATDCGVSLSFDAGLTWTHRAGPPGGYRAVEAIGPGRAVAAGPNGVWYTEDNGATWTPSETRLGVVRQQAIARSPYDPREAFMLDAGVLLYRTGDGGRTWSRLPNLPGAASCGGYPYLKVAPIGPTSGARRGYVFFQGSRCSHAWAEAAWTANDGFRFVPFSSTGSTVTSPVPGTTLSATERAYDCCRMFWAQLRGPVLSDARDLLIDEPPAVGGVRPAPVPFLSSGDQGVERRMPDGSWRAVGSGPGGINALQIQQIAGQIVGDGARREQHLYFVTWHTGLWSSADPERGGWVAAPGIAEAAQIQLASRVGDRDASVALFDQGEASGRSRRSGALFDSIRAWPDPSTPNSWIPFFVRDDALMQYYSRSETDTGFAVTSDFGARWIYAPLPGVAAVPESSAAISMMGFGAPSLSAGGAPFVHYAYSAGRSLRLLRMQLIPGSPTRVAAYLFPAMRNFGGLGQSFNHENAEFGLVGPVFGADPREPMRLLAPDVVNDRMAMSLNGGETWNCTALEFTAGACASSQTSDEMRSLTRLVTGNGARRFSRNGVPLVSIVSFNPDTPRQALVGAVQGGLYFSGDRGRNFRLVPGSERITAPTDVYWASSNLAYVSTWGRGLWKLDIRLGTDWNALSTAAADLTRAGARIIASVGDDPFAVIAPGAVGGSGVADRVLLVRGGRVLGVQAADGVVTGIDVSHGAAHVLHGVDRSFEKGASASDKIEVRTAGGQDAVSLDGLGAFKGVLDKGVLIGVALSGAKAVGVVLADEELPLDVDKSDMPLVETGAKSPPDDRDPVIRIDARRSAASVAAVDGAEAELTVRGWRFERGGVVEALIDDVAVQPIETAWTKAGAIRLTIRPGTGTFGLKRLTLRQKTQDGRLLEASAPFVVLHAEREEEVR